MLYVNNGTGLFVQKSKDLYSLTMGHSPGKNRTPSEEMAAAEDRTGKQASLSGGA
jgi:hypothetical protein